MKYINITFLLFILIFNTYVKTNEDKGSYPTNVICSANKKTVEWVKKTQPLLYAEFGLAQGNTVSAIAKNLPKNATIMIFDFNDKVEKIANRLHSEGFSNVQLFGNSYKIRDSYNWSLIKLLKKHSEPIFDYVFLDGAHTWDVDALTFFLIDRLLKIGGYIDFDDYDWTLAKSPTLNPKTFPLTEKFYTQEQINAPHVKFIVDLLVKSNNRYIEIEKNKIYQKIK